MKKLILASLVLLVIQAQAGEFSRSLLYNTRSLWNGYKPEDGKQFVLCQIHSNGAHNPMEAKQKVYFDEGSDSLSETEKQKLKQFFSELSSTLDSISLSAFADKCGDEKENLELSQHRAETVRQQISEITPTHSQIYESPLGEARSSTHSKHDRYVEVTVHGRVLSPKIENVYLIDGSGSFASKKSLKGLTFGKVKKLFFKPGTIVYMVRESSLGCPSTDLNDYVPEGDTFIKEAQGVIASQVKDHLNVITITDQKEIFTPEESQIFSSIMAKTRALGNEITWHYY